MSHAIKQQALGLLHDYQAAVFQAVALLNAKSVQHKGFQAQEESPGVWAGYLDEERQVRYHLHGVGCLISAPAFKVDFDYATEGGCAGVDPWFMRAFLQDNPAVQRKYPTLMSGGQIEQVLQELVEDGVLVKHLYSSFDWRYYLAPDASNPTPPTVTFYTPDEDGFPPPQPAA